MEKRLMSKRTQTVLGDRSLRVRHEKMKARNKPEIEDGYEEKEVYTFREGSVFRLDLG